MLQVDYDHDPKVLYDTAERLLLGDPKARSGSLYASCIVRPTEANAARGRRALAGQFGTFNVVGQFVHNRVDPLFCEPHGKRRRSNRPG